MLIHLVLIFLCIISNDGPGREWADDLELLLQQRPGVGVRCMDPDIYTIKLVATSVQLPNIQWIPELRPPMVEAKVVLILRWS